MVRLFVLFVLLQSKVAAIKADFFASQLSSESILIDVQTHEEFVAGHIEGAINIAVTSDDFSSIINQFPKKGAVYIYCRSGKRSTRAANQKKTMGFKKIVELEGGYLAWKKMLAISE